MELIGLVPRLSNRQADRGGGEGEPSVSRIMNVRSVVMTSNNVQYISNAYESNKNHRLPPSWQFDHTKKA